MMSEDIKMTTYSQVLQELESTDQCSHLLLGNGFNTSLGIKTDYKNIFKEMVKEEPIYRKIESQMKEQNHDIEKLIGKLKESLKEESNLTDFLDNYLENKVKFDFMKSASSIVRREIKNIYHDKNKRIYLLFKNFSNYFTLNYDTFLYLILMKFKKSKFNSSKAIAFQNSFQFMQENLNEVQSKIYRKVKEARCNGEITTQIDDQASHTNLKILNKDLFQQIVKNHFKEENWKNKDIKRVCDQIWEEEKDEYKLEHVNDGFEGELFKSNNENVFFLHGSFHIYKDKRIIKKITQSENKAFHKRLEEIIHADEEDIICILTNTSKNKRNQINSNQYLSKCFNKLSDLSGNFVILGASLDENDRHIFDAVNNSSVSRLYISSSVNSKCKNSKRAKQFFPEKEIILFDYKTISYN